MDSTLLTPDKIEMTEVVTAEGGAGDVKYRVMGEKELQVLCDHANTIVKKD